MKRRGLSLFAILLLPVFIFLSKITTVQAADSDTKATHPTTQEVFQGAPPCLKLEDYFEKVDTYQGTTAVSNSVQILKATDSGYPSDIIRLTNGNNQVGSVWGKANSTSTTDTNYNYNYLDLSKDQEISGWIYIGDSDAYGKTGDGLALVLQNDARGINAISTYNWSVLFQNKSKAVGGETLGVWGGVDSPTDISNTTKFAQGAIQNSLAIEFDSYRNETKSAILSSQDNYFDALTDSTNVLEAKGEHIAWNYPGEASTYERFSYSLGSYFGMHHKDSIHNLTIAGYDGTPEIDRAWHHFTFKYTKPETSGGTTAKMSYIFNDKNYDGSVRPFSKWDKRENISIDLNKFNLNSGQTKIRWGFTGGTGSPDSKVADNSIILEKIPAVANVLSATSLFDITQNREILDLDQNPTADSKVNNNDQLRFDYDLNYDSGLSKTGNITTELNLPTYVDFTQNDDGIGKIIYTDEDGNEISNDIPDSALTSDKTTLNLTLNSMDLTNKKIKIELYGYAKAPDSETANVITVPQAHTSYQSDHYTGDVMSPQFEIDNESLNLTATSDTNQEIIESQSTTLSGLANYLKGSTFDGNGLSVHAKIDDGDEVIWNDISTTAGDKEAIISKELTGKYLGVGNHKIDVYLTDSSRRISNTITYNIQVIERKLELTPQDEEITVNDNKPVTITGNYNYSDDSGFQNDTATITYQITNEGEDSQESVTTTISQEVDAKKGSAKISLDPIALNKATDISLDDYLKTNNVGLKEGKNEITMVVSDTADNPSNKVTFVVNVPKMEPLITTKDSQLYSLGMFPIEIPLTFEYPTTAETNNYQLSSNDLELNSTIDGVTYRSKPAMNGDIENPYAWNPIVELNDLGIKELDKTTYTVKLYVTDPYGRKSNELTYQIDFNLKGAEVLVDDSSFKTIDPKTFETGYVARNNDWNVKVRSYNSKWKLNASGTKLQNTIGNKDTDLNMFYVDEYSATSLLNDPQIASDDQTNSGNQVFDISGNWNHDEGILLKTDSVPEAGDYQGKITWSIDDSI
ncbi:hypothetical protein [Companilactobacillus halodurans]|uniref:Cell surface protein n=1 Tax=Companilactobacillus halodurans TaxID=2584183 RepID=A0A5P0ZYP0_9LACO|nr:hypothetical protein [Companilactobacillus halodurans]MQS76583.1 hypothetical protein [Companilactobacillus halodurans]MQS98213.1 hypothetical protein [Companilactobacillus halodurans]